MKILDLYTGIETISKKNSKRVELPEGLEILHHCIKPISECALVTPDIDLEVESLYVEQINNQLLNTWI